MPAPRNRLRQIHRAWALLVTLVVSTGRPDLAAAELPVSFARVAAAARAATIVIRVPDSEAVEPECADDRPDGGCEPAEFLAVRRERTLGAGVIVDPSGIALTSARAVQRDPRFEIVLIDGTPLKATVLGLDRRTDVAVLKLDNGGAAFPHLPFGDSERAVAGDWVIAVGAPSGLEGTVTAGIITATPSSRSGSPLSGFLQTDAAMSRGNAGGPLVNLNGEVVGLNTLLRGGGIGYAIPSGSVRKVYLELLEKGKVSRPWLGVATQSLTPDLARALGAHDAAGVLIADVLPEGPAAAGLRPGDILLEVDGVSISSRAQFERATGALVPGRVAKLKIRRGGRELIVSLRVAEEPDEWQVPPALARARRLLGIEARPITPTMGAVAGSIELGSAADRAGLEAGDVIREVNRQPIRTIADFLMAVRALMPGAQVLMLIQRGDVALYVVMLTDG
jgi:S1-C subfamily serine protease